MLKYIVRRLLLIIPVLLGAIIIIFTIRCYSYFFKPSSVYSISGEAHPNIMNILKDLFFDFPG